MVATIAAARFAEDAAESWPSEGAAGGASGAGDVGAVSRTATSCVAASLWESEELLAECAGAGLGFFGPLLGASTIAVDVGCVTVGFAAIGVVVAVVAGRGCGVSADLRKLMTVYVAIAISRMTIRAMAS